MRCNISIGQLFSFYAFVILSLAFYVLSDQIDDKLTKGIETLQKAIKSKCEDKSKKIYFSFLYLKKKFYSKHKKFLKFIEVIKMVSLKSM